ncbi:MAG: ABC transporter ATP-binding protein [Clostridia bacterium]|nr:ABC transporter ATP-binding protein [Clostridia bacterium]
MKNKTLKRTYDLAKPHKKTIIIVSILSLLVAITEIVRPYLMEIVIDQYLTKGLVKQGFLTITMIGFIYLGLVVIGNAIDFIAMTTTNMMGEEIIYSLRNRLFRYTQNANIPFHDKTSAGKLFVRITNDIEDISMLFKDIISTFLKDFIMIIAVMVVMIYISISLSMMAFFVIPFIIFFSYTLTKMLNKIYDKAKIIRTNLNTFLAESIYGAKIIKIFNIQNEKQKELEKYTKTYRDTRGKEGIIQALLPGIMTILENFSIAFIIWACIHHWFGIDLEVGFIYVFTTYINKLFEPITRIVENIETVQEAFVSINKVYDILEEKQYLEDFESGKELKKIKGKIEFKHVWFSYDSKTWVLQDVSFTIEPGQSIAFVGKTGSGKTTIINLINRFYDIQKGEILIDGINIKEINLRNLRSHIGTILQDPFIFAKSIKDNIRLNRNLEDEAVKKAIELASANEFIDNLPNGIEEISKERGNSYSAGQKQLLAFARVFAHEPDIFILDEATANIDTYTESLIQKSIQRISAEKTSIFIAHRLSTIVNVDKIIVLYQGKIIEQGNHKELVQTGGYYSKLYNSYYESLG